MSPLTVVVVAGGEPLTVTGVPAVAVTPVGAAGTAAVEKTGSTK